MKHAIREVPHDSAQDSAPATDAKKRHPHRWRRRILISLAILVILLGIARAMLPSALRWYVNRVIDRNPLYDGKIGAIEVHLWRGAYSIDDVRLIKTTGNVPIPLFSAKRVDFA